MRTSKAFRLFYLMTLAVFIVFATALAIRCAQLWRGTEFYGRLGETEVFTSSDFSDLTSAAVSSFGPEEQALDSALPQIHEQSLRLAQFAEQYPETVMWLQLPGTALDYPVMLGTDNQFYLDHLPDGSRNVLGSLFLDYRTGEDSVHLIVYGHNGSKGKMFGLLKQYRSQDYFLEHKTLTLATLDCVWDCPIFSVRRVEADSDAYCLEFENSGGLTDYISQAVEQSLYQIDVDLEDVAGVLTLSTCTGWRDERFIVQAILPPANQVWFSAYGGERRP